MDPDLDDKTALFSRLQDLEQIDETDDQILEAEEANHRAKCKAFAHSSPRKPTPRTRSTVGGTSTPRLEAPRRTASDSAAVQRTPRATPRADVIIIEDTPEPEGNPTKRPQLASLLNVTFNEEIISVPDSVQASSSQPSRKVSRPQLRRTNRSSPSAEDTPSVTMGKRKRPTKLNMAPEAQQWFKGSSFFYFPNNDTNAVRERRITKAREHGAEWVRTLREATHLIVDADLTHKDLEKAFSANELADKIVVNDVYPMECISYRTFLKPDREKFKVQGLSSTLNSSVDPPQSSETSERSLQPKAPRSRARTGHLDPAATPPRSDASTQKSTQLSSGNVISDSQLGSQKATADVDHENSVSQEEMPLDVSQAGAEGKADEDELAQIIHFAKANPDANVDAESEMEDDRRPSSADISTAPSIEQTAVDNGRESSDDEPQRKNPRKTKAKRLKNENWQDKFACMKGGTKDAKPDNPNADTIAMLQSMCDHYTRNNEHWRVTAYRRAISALRQQSTKILTSSQAKDIAGIGDRLADKIEEIVTTGRLRRLEEAANEPNHEARELFLKVYDVGLQTAEKWIAQGYRTLDDLLERANLSRNQRIGVEHFDDLNTRIPRAEVEALGDHVRRVARELDSRVELLIGGSYRRGSDSSGDIDFIVTKKGTTASADLGPFLDELVGRLMRQGFLTAGLATSRSDTGNKWHGCCVLPKEEFPGDRTQYKPIWRRIDFLLVPETEFGAALLYFTGNDLFNRSMRLLGDKKGMCLNQRGLFRGVIRGPGRVKYTDGELVEGRDEKKIFEALGVQWREPHQRWC
ncbi:hypothetical protein PFICI_01384 [Pestalotiopsis fici W106-1]|uniref:DNA polymerase lambda n=1 Tax=Pestalotiopsis fici (strain W106-1 / CGMCC3.15140) TaxID=1229662 RepID=W3XQL7_PESFW|nr:uncharacterized protein PFICI_01384 [Pestalotiopsis fici W106-1]ETS87556.1 hypothetical protein PFICI_01384 [Pestalotiopsis fici W106-1]